MDNNLNYYELLGLKQNASEEEIKAAYKKQMKKWHPDINKSNDATTISSKINEAKEILLDPEKRKDYDEYLDKKILENYEKYTKVKKKDSYNTKKENYEQEKVTKWQYLNEWLKYAKVSFIRKLFGTIGVLLESLLCFIIKHILIILSYVSFFVSYFIRLLYSYLSPILVILFILSVGMFLTNGFNQTTKDNPEIVPTIAIIIGMYVLSYVLPVIAKNLLSPKVFDLLYNKIDITLFKYCVGYKD